MIKKFFKHYFFPKKKEEKEPDIVKYLITGLGNIGPDYQDTRHNIGFMIADKLASKKDVAFTSVRYGDKAVFKHKGRIFIVIKPSTYMNLSGKAVNYWLTKEKINVNNLLVLVDDVALPLGTIRIKTKGGDGGHNGLNSIITNLGTSAFSRLRFGIGDGFGQGQQVNFVLGKWTQEEKTIILPRLEEAVEAILSFGTIGPERTMNVYNTKK